MTTPADATTATGRAFSAITAEMNGVAEQGGPEAVARWALPNGTEEEWAAIAGLWRRLQEAQAATEAA